MFSPHDKRLVSELMHFGGGSGINFSEESAQTVLEVRNTIEQLTNSRKKQQDGS